MDNRIFSVNGGGMDLLIKALELAFLQDWYSPNVRADGWSESFEHGIILQNYNPTNAFKTPLTAEEVAPMVFHWIDENFDNITLDDWGEDIDLDGHTSRGWRVYVDDWGHVGDHHNVLCAVKPCYLWHGK